jgi:PAS domain S-box-containing protein
MRKKITTINLMLIIIVILTVFSACEKRGRQTMTLLSLNSNPFETFRDIPGVTADEIAGIEALKERYAHFIYGVDHTTEAFPVYMGRENEIGGYAALLCEWLTRLFGIPFIPVLYEDDWERLLLEYESGKVHFMGELMLTDERMETHLMTSAISERLLTTFQIAETESIVEIAKNRLPRLAFPRDFAPYNNVIEIAEYEFESFFIENLAQAYRLLKDGEVDAFVAMNTIKPLINRHGDVVGETFFPLVFASASLSTHNADMEPVISIVQKALENGGRSYLSELYTQSGYDYIKNELNKQLTREELDYIRSNRVVKVASEAENYPLSFYNTTEKEYQGIFFDMMKEVSLITGLSFEVANAPGASFLELAAMVESNEASIFSTLRKTKEREERFLFSKTPIIKDYIVLISKFEYPNIHFNEMFDVMTGSVRGTVHAELLKRWFPNNMNYKEYDNMDSLFNALKRGEVDMMIAGATHFLSIENYKELPGYKINVEFDYNYDLSSAFNKDEAILCAIVDKALTFVDLETISAYWTNKKFDYRVKVAEARLPWLISATTLSLIILGLVLVMFYRKNNEGKRLANLVAEETSTLTAIFNSTPDHIFCKDLDSMYIRHNKSFKDYYNIDKSFVGKLKADDLGLPADLVAYNKTMDKKVFNGEVSISEITIPSPEGKEKLFEVIKSPLIHGNKVTGLVGMARDITGRKAAEDEAKRASAESMKAYAEAENASEAKSRFLANMSHEMRTPMNVIVGLTDLMLEEDIPGNIRDTFKKINIAGNTLMGLINDVLDISKVEAGKLDLKLVQYDVASLLNDIIILNTIRIEEKPIKFILDIKDDMPQSLFGDDLRIKQVLNNLLSNAFKYTKEGSVTLGVSCHRANSASVWLSFYIKDTGIGIRGQDIIKLFTDYNQVDTQANRTIEGTGLGLSITKKFVELMDGEITVESDYGKGTTFYTTIRQGFVSEEKLASEIIENLRNFQYLEKKGEASERLVRSDLSYARVLVVDDFPINLDVAAGMLRKYKMQVDCVLTGQESVDLITAKEPVYDAIFMDHMMPIMDGIEATKLIRALGTKYSRDIPIIALTANAIVGNEQMFIKNGFNAYLPKPFNAASLDSIVQRWVRDKSRE